MFEADRAYIVVIPDLASFAELVALEGAADRALDELVDLEGEEES